MFKSLLTAKKCRAFGGLVNDKCFSLINHQNTIARDITKCYTSIMYNPVEEWIKLDFNDCWIECDDVNNIELG